MRVNQRHLESLVGSLLVCCLASCATEKDPKSEKPAFKGMSERMNEGGGYMQDKEGNWVTKGDKRSSYDSQRDSPYFKGKVDKETYKTGDYAKKSWWGSKEYATKQYGGNTDGSKFRKTARQEGQMARANGQKAEMAGPFKTNTLDRKSARESTKSAVEKPLDARTQSERGNYKVPAVIDWRAQRNMSVDQSKGILGR